MQVCAERVHHQPVHPLHPVYNIILLLCMFALSFLLSSSDGVRFIASTYKGTEGVNNSILVTVVAEPITNCLRSFTVYVTSRDGSATSECHATYYSQTNLFSGNGHV